MAKKYLVTKKPSGFKLSRVGKYKYTAEWKTKDKDIIFQELQYSIVVGPTKKAKTYYIKLNSKATSKTFTMANWHRNDYTAIDAYIWQRRKDTKDTLYYANEARTAFEVSIPKQPSVGASLDDTSWNKTTFAWAVPNADDKSKYIFYRVRIETILLVDSNIGDGKKVPWGKATQWTDDHASGSWPKVEDTAGWSLRTHSYTRWFRVRAEGPAGNSGWAYAKHVYALPNAASGISGSLTKNNSGYTCQVSWTNNVTNARPVDANGVEVCYIAETPASTTSINRGVRKTTLSCPQVDNWQVAKTGSDSSGKAATTFNVGDILETDKCFFVLVRSKHDTDHTDSIPILVRNGYGKLPTPTLEYMGDPDPSTNIISMRVNNSSEISAVFTAVYYRTTDNMTNFKRIGVIPGGGGEHTASIKLPTLKAGTNFSIGIQSLIADYSPTTVLEDAPTYYSITNVRMSSDIVWTDAAPLPPQKISITKLPTKNDTVQISWDWSWAEATATEISWADHSDAWMSNSEPTVYTVNNTKASQWNITGLSPGTWYFRLRFVNEQDGQTKYGTYSETIEQTLSSAPVTPNLEVEPSVITKDGEVTCYWVYGSNDGTGQMGGYIHEAFINETTGEITYSEQPIGEANGEIQNVVLSAEKLGWIPGETHLLAVTVMSASGESCDGFSSPVPVSIADELVPEVLSTSLVEYTKETTDEEDEPFVETKVALDTLPLVMNVAGVGESGTITVHISRAEEYHNDRPDESTYDGYIGEIVATKERNGDGEIRIEADDILGFLDDTASYNIRVILSDNLGQKAELDPPIEFEVHWDEQALQPSATLEFDPDNEVMFITPTAEEIREGASFDIYRLSADSPVLIYEGATHDETYVDPYPTIGDSGGYRIVYKSKYGDYIDEYNVFAWEDYATEFYVSGTIINFGNNILYLPYNVTISNQWAKDFKETKYLGGAIQGDWNPAVSKTVSISTDIPLEYEPDAIQLTRRLASYAGECHIRTQDGSNFAANVSVKDDREMKMVGQIARISLDITRVDSSSSDGMTYDEWVAKHPE